MCRLIKTMGVDGHPKINQQQLRIHEHLVQNLTIVKLRVYLTVCSS